MLGFSPTCRNVTSECLTKSQIWGGKEKQCPLASLERVSDVVIVVLSFFLSSSTVSHDVGNYFNCKAAEIYAITRAQAVTDFATDYLGLIQSVLSVSINFARTETHTTLERNRLRPKLNS